MGIGSERWRSPVCPIQNPKSKIQNPKFAPRAGLSPKAGAALDCVETGVQRAAQGGEAVHQARDFDRVRRLPGLFAWGRSAPRRLEHVCPPGPAVSETVHGGG